MKHRANLVISLIVLVSLMSVGFSLTGAQDEKIVMVSIMGSDDVPNS